MKFASGTSLYHSVPADSVCRHGNRGLTPGMRLPLDSGSLAIRYSHSIALPLRRLSRLFLWLRILDVSGKWLISYDFDVRASWHTRFRKQPSSYSQRRCARSQSGPPGCNCRTHSTEGLWVRYVLRKSPSPILMKKHFSPPSCNTNPHSMRFMNLNTSNVRQNGFLVSVSETRRGKMRCSL